MTVIQPTSSASSLSWQETQFSQLKKDYASMTRQFYLDGVYEYENEWPEGIALCRKTVTNCEKIIREVSEKLTTCSTSFEREKLVQLKDRATIFLKYFKDEEDRAKTSSWACPLYYYSGYTLALTAAHSIYRTINAPRSVVFLFNNLIMSGSLTSLTTKTAVVALMIFSGIKFYNEKRIEQYRESKNQVDLLIKSCNPMNLKVLQKG